MQFIICIIIYKYTNNKLFCIYKALYILQNVYNALRSNKYDTFLDII